MELAHLSDLHVKPPFGGLGWAPFANKRVLGRLNLALKRSHPRAILEAALDDLRADPPDHLAITGDLTNLGLEREFELAAELIGGLDWPPEQLSVIPGNHDAYLAEAVEERRFERHIGPLLGLSPEEVRWPRVQERGGVLLVSLNSALPVPWFKAWGRVGDEQREALSEILAESQAGLKLVLVHHPPLIATGQPDKARRGLRDAWELIEVCRQGGARAVLSGHTHHGFRYDLPAEGESGPLSVLCAGSTTEATRVLGRAATYSRYRLDPASSEFEHERRGYDPELGRFVALAPAKPAASEAS